jgi:WD40 repeat protein
VGYSTGRKSCTDRTVPAAHYRAILCMVWSAVDTNGCHLVTGGADGMVHIFSHIDLVEQQSAINAVQPIRTWTKHHLAVTALTAINGGRMASASEDGQVVVMEISSGATLLAAIQLPDAIRALTTD